MKRPTLKALILCLMACHPWGAWAETVHVSGLVDLAHREGDKRSTVNNNLAGDSPFNDLRVKLFVDAWPASWFGVMTELLYDESGGTANVIRFDGAYGVFLGIGSPLLNAKVGKIPSPFGSFAPRSYSDKNPLVGLPLMYHYHTLARNDRVPANFDSLQTYRQIRSPGRGGGMPILYDSCWNIGATLFGSSRTWEYNVGMTQGTPSSMRASSNDGFLVLGRVGFKPVIGLRLGLSGAWGPYLIFGATGVPKGGRLENYKQKLVGADLEYSYGHLAFYSEVVRNRWDSPAFRNGLGNASWYLEWKYTFRPGLFGAVRYSGMRFDEVDSGKGTMLPWDGAVRRVESGLGYQVGIHARLKLVWQHTYVEGDREEETDILVGQVSLSF